MATALELLDWLKQTGTRGRKLAPVEALVERRPDAPGREAVEALRQAGAGPVTLAKAEHLERGAPLGELLGKPPKSLADRTADGKQIADSLKTIADEIKDRAKDRSPGKLEKAGSVGKG